MQVTPGEQHRPQLAAVDVPTIIGIRRTVKDAALAVLSATQSGHRQSGTGTGRRLATLAIDGCLVGCGCAGPSPTSRALNGSGVRCDMSGELRIPFNVVDEAFAQFDNVRSTADRPAGGPSRWPPRDRPALGCRSRGTWPTPAGSGTAGTVEGYGCRLRVGGRRRTPTRTAGATSLPRRGSGGGERGAARDADPNRCFASDAVPARPHARLRRVARRRPPRRQRRDGHCSAHDVSCPRRTLGARTRPPTSTR